MSVFTTITSACPDCGAAVPFELIQSIAADRRSDLRDAILDNTFQRRSCDDCGAVHRIEPQFSYLDIANKLWIAAWPQADLDKWGSQEARTLEVFDDAFGPKAPKTAREIGSEIQTRATFGWAALREKILASVNGIDDVALETLKAALLQTTPFAPGVTALRLLEVDDESLVLGHLDLRSDNDVHEAIRVPRSALDEVTAEAFDATRALVSAGPFVDLQRNFVGQA